MSDAPLILGVSGLRGIVGESLTPEVAVRYAQAIGAWVARQDPWEDWLDFVVAHDGRAGHEMVYHAVIAGLLANGWRVIPLGRAMTPTVGVAVDSSGYIAGGVMVTASHNPQEWNGIKFIYGAYKEGLEGRTASAPSGHDSEQIIAVFQSEDYAWPDSDDLSKGVPSGSFRSPGLEQEDMKCTVRHAQLTFASVKKLGLLGSQPAKQTSEIRVVVDSINASGSDGAALLFGCFNSHFTQLAGDDTGIFPHTPEPTKENLSGEGGLCDAVPRLKADVGFAQDPDADRLAIVDEQGNYIGEEYTLVLCAMALMEARVGQDSAGNGKPVFVVNLSTSRMIDDVAKHYGGEVVRTAVGEANVVEAMKSLKASGRDVVLGGEGNGGVIWAEVTYVRDSLSGMALVLSLMARTGKTVSQLEEMINGLGPTDEVKASGYTIIKKKSALAKKSDAEPVVEHLRGIYSEQGDCRVDLQDGIRIDWDERGVWAHVRASNTEPIMRVIVEAPSSEEAESVAATIDGQIGAMGS